jgi:hypothetical protein
MTIYTEHCNENVQNSLYKLTCQLVQGLNQMLVAQQLKASIRKERIQLMEMSDHMLKDIGISREQAKEESKREDIPATRFNREI